MLTHLLAKSIATALARRTDRGVRARMQKIRLSSLLSATAGVLWLTMAAAQAPSAPTPPPAPAVATAKCQEAVVNPVSGFAECVKPRGAAVATPPKRPDAVRDARDR